MSRVLVAVLTYRRPGDLADLLPLLAAQRRGVAGRQVELLVVDNDPEGGAAGQVAAAATASGGPAYAHEPRPGIAAARNRALDEAAEHDVLVFLDDDERPSPGWLADLLPPHEERPRPRRRGPRVLALRGARRPVNPGRRVLRPPADGHRDAGDRGGDEQPAPGSGGRAPGRRPLRRAPGPRGRYRHPLPPPARRGGGSARVVRRGGRHRRGAG